MYSVCLTGVSSFTGFWFAKVLSEAGHSVCCPLPRPRESYEGLKKKRLDSLPIEVDVIYEAPFGSVKFVELIDKKFDAFCLHGAYVSGYNQANFSVTEALRQNLYRAEEVLAMSKKAGCKRVIWTSSIFEDAVCLDAPEHVSHPIWHRYALSKKLSGLALRSLCSEMEIGFSQFVITNPFGPLEDPKLCCHLAKAVLAEETFEVRTPHYVRDMIHVRHLAEAYRNFVLGVLAGEETSELRPCEFTGSLGEFARLFVREMGERLGGSCSVTLATSMPFDEPFALVNNTHVSTLVDDYAPNERWNELGAHYQSTF